MNPQRLAEFQQKLTHYQQTLSETIKSPNYEVVVIFNGAIEIIQLQINVSSTDPLYNKLLVDTINKGIKTVSLKVNEGVKIISLEMISNQ